MGYDLIYDRISEQYLADTSLLATELEKTTKTSLRKTTLVQAKKLKSKLNVRDMK